MLVELRRGANRGHKAIPARELVPRRVALVSVPFGGVDSPSLALGLLAESLRREGHHVDVHHLDLDVVDAFGLATYRWVAEDSGWKLLVGEWLGADPQLTPNVADTERFRRLLDDEGTGAWRRRLKDVDLPRLRARLDQEVERWAAMSWSGYDVVGFTVMFQQLNLSLRLARAIKERTPHVRVVLGGINLENPTGGAIARSFPWIDAIFSGYADKTFPRYVADLPSTPGVVITPGAERVTLDDLPVPTYDEYVARLRELGLEGRVRPQIPLETSRGCWWGMKHHCTFCGLNGEQMDFVSKSPERVIDEIRALGRYNKKLFIVDNILSARVYDDLLPKMAAAGVKLSLRWSASLKANLTRVQLTRLVDAGIDVINPGIESLSSELLRMMDKGETSLQNVWLLRACREMAIDPEYHLLHGFPGEDPVVYRDQAALIGRIHHLPPPRASVPVALVRFSPMHRTPEKFGIRDLRPHRAYAHAFGDHPMLGELAYVFEYAFPSPLDPVEYARPMIDAVRAWQRAHALCEVVSRRGRIVLDSRTRPRLFRLSSDAFRLLERLDRPTAPATLSAEWPTAALRAALDELRRRDLILDRDGRLMRLVVFHDERSVVRRVAQRVVTAIRRAR